VDEKALAAFRRGNYRQRVYPDVWETANPLYAFAQLRRWFDEYLTKVANRFLPGPEDLFTCPCCGYPTQDEPGGFETCYLCYWRDDGQDDPEADRRSIWPNEGTLTGARLNFARYLVCFGETSRSPLFTTEQRAGLVQAKKDLTRVFDRIHRNADIFALPGLWDQVRGKSEEIDRVRRRYYE
jgi:hypothetical protein